MSKFTKLFNNPSLFLKDSIGNKKKFDKNTIFVIGFSTWKSYLRKYFPDNRLVFLPKNINKVEFDALYKVKITSLKKYVQVFVWGYKAPDYLLSFLKQNDISVKYVEDGFIRSVNLGATKTPPMSLCLDSKGAYFDATQPTELEDTLQNFDFTNKQDLLDQARRGISLLIDTGVSKYNSSDWIDIDTIYGQKTQRRVLVIGQVEDDASILFGMLSKMRGNDLVRKAKEENPDAQIIYKPHPDVLHGHRPQNSSVDDVRDICLVLNDVPLANAFETIDHVYTMTSLAGMEALIRGIKVTTFGCPFYAGWGLTDDRKKCEGRDRKLSVEELFAISYLEYPKYFDTDSGEGSDFFRTVNIISDQIGKTQSVSKAYIQSMKSSLAYEEVIEYLDSKILEESSYGLLLEKAKVFFEILEFESALQVCEEALQIEKTSELAYLKASCLQKLGRFSSELEEHYKLALKLAKPNMKNQIAYTYFSYMWEAYPLNEGFLKEVVNYLNNTAPDYRKYKSFGKLKLLLAAMLAEIGQLHAVMKYRNEAKQLKAVEKNLMFLRYRMRQRGEKKAIDNYKFEQFDRLIGYKGTFKKLVLDADADVCIVGNGPAILGKRLGEEIDNHKVVVRFNSYNTEYPYSEDYGCKTDVWVRMPFHPYVKNEPESGHKLIMFSGSNRYHRPYTEWDSLFELTEMGFPVEFFDPKAFYELQAELGSPPSAGLMLCYMLYKIIGPLKPSNFYGFSYLDEANDQYHYSDKNADTGKRHDWSTESDFFKTLLAEDGAPFESRVLKIKSLSDNLYTSDLNKRVLKKDYDLVISTSPGLLEYKISNQLPVYVSSLSAENHVLFINSHSVEGKESPELSDLTNKEILVLGFGRAKTGLIAEKLAQSLSCDFKLVEYGLISSMALPSEKQFNFSLVMDDEGIFYDTTSSSQIESILYNDLSLFTPESIERARWLIKKVSSRNITKYNNSGNIVLNSKQVDKHSILVVDQTANDNSIILGQCEEYSFEDMLKDALDRPNSEVYLKLHPETVEGAKGGNLTVIDKFRHMTNLHIVDMQCNIISLIKQVDEVFVMTSGVGLEALIIGKPVTCYGFPFYAGWGLTKDRVIANNKRKRLTLEALVYAVYVTYSSYFNPETLEPCEMEEVIEWIINNKQYHSNVIYKG